MSEERGSLILLGSIFVKARQRTLLSHSSDDLHGSGAFSQLRELTIWRPRGGFLSSEHASLDPCRGGHSKVIAFTTGSRERAPWSSADGRIYSCLSCRKDSILDIWVSLTGGQYGSGEQRLEDETC